jgi:hypothetical protein
MKNLKTGLTATALLLGLGGHAAYAACPADGATPFFAGPVDPVNGFSTYVEDSQGLALALCLNANVCFFDPVIPGNLFSEQIGFGAEGFWWLSEAAITTAGGLDALIVMGAEAAFANEVPDPAETFPFTRLRIRVDIATPGIYTITHPYGQETYVLPTAGTRVINDSFDIEFMPDAVNQGRVAPWLTWDTFPTDPALDLLGNDGVADFVGDINVLHAIKGSPCGNNFFRISAVGLDGITPIAIDPADEDGDGRTDRFTETQFAVQGRVFPGNVETPLTVDGVNYTRNAGGITRLNVHATAPTTAEVSFDTTVDGAVSADAVPLGNDGARFFATELLGNAAPPTTVEVIATNVAQPNNDTAVRVVPVHDTIHVLLATYQTASGTLDVAAESSDEFNPPTLTVVGFGDLDAAGTLRASNLAVAPATVTIQSSAGGVTVVPVQVVNP